MNKHRILLVDDNPTSLKLLKALYEIDYDVLTANDGLEALEVLFQHKVDLVITDILMPNMDGYYLCYKIRTKDILQDIPIIVYTATYTSLSEAQVANEMGATMFIRKPAAIKQLLTVVKDILAEPQKFPHKIPSKHDSTEMMHHYNTKLVTKLEQSNIELEDIKAKLERSEARLKEAQSIAHVGGWEIDMANNLLYWSDEQFNLLGYKRDEVIPTNELFFSLIHPEDSEFVHKRFNETFETFENSSSNFRLKLKNGTIKHVYCEWKFEFDRQQRPVRIYGIVQDVTEKREAEAKIENSEKRFRAFFENAPEAILVMDLNSFTFIRSNANTLKLLKYSEEQLSKMSPADVSPEFQPDGYSSKEKAQKLIGRAMEGEKPIFEWVIRNAEGNDILCEVRLVALTDSSGAQLLASFIDITERKKAEEELRTAHNRLLFHVENAPLGFIEWDEHLHVKSWSKQAEHIFGWTQEEFIAMQKDGYSLVYEEDLAWTSKVAQQLLSGEVERNSIQHRNYTKDKKVIWCEWFNSILKDENGKVITLMSLVQDITERKEAENKIRELNEHLEDRVSERTAELTEANKGLEGFSYSVSHDLRAPARAIVGFSKIIQDEYGSSMAPGLKELFVNVESNGKRMSIIIEDLLTLARYGKEKLKLSKVDMTQLFNSVWGNIKRIMPFDTVLELQPLPCIQADISMLEQVLVNLLSNAIKYSSKKEHPVVQVGFKEENDRITYFVKDNGAGFDMKYYDRLFGVFQRLHSASDFEGTGVGLLLVKRIVEKHAGTVWAEGKVGEGATFWFSLPKITAGKSPM